MQSNEPTAEQYLQSVRDERKPAMSSLRKVIKDHLPEGFHEEMNYGMIGCVVQHSIYPKGYHCDPKLPLPFISIASQKNFLGFYHLGIYASPDLLNWFTGEFPKHSKRRLDMGKSCTRFKLFDEIPLDLYWRIGRKNDSSRLNFALRTAP